MILGHGDTDKFPKMHSCLKSRRHILWFEAIHHFHYSNVMLNVLQMNSLNQKRCINSATRFMNFSLLVDSISSSRSG